MKYKHNNIMLIDDSEIDNYINEHIIKGSLFAENIYIHTSVKSALEFFRNITICEEIIQKLIPSYIFLDMNMPIMDGFQFLDEFEKLNFEGKEDIDIIMLTSSVNPIDINKSKTYKSITDYHHKPLTENYLEKL
jgi:CheY-like chemotaxis protein